jgi:hypothetical protein
MVKVIVQVLDLPAVKFEMCDDYNYPAYEIAEDVVSDFLELGYLSTSNISSQYSVLVQINEKKYNVDVQLVGC